MRMRLVPLFLSTTRVVCFFTTLSLFGAACAVSPPTAPTPTLTLVPSPTAYSQPSVRVGVYIVRSAVATMEEYGPLIVYLAQNTGRPFELVPVNPEELFPLIEQKQLDFFFANPLAAVQARRLYSAEFLATLSRPKTGSKFGGLIIVRSDSGLTTVEDLRNKRGGCLNFDVAAAGCLFQVYHLRERGLNPFSDFASLVEVPSQDSIVLAVLNGALDVGFVRTGQLEDMLAAGLITEADISQITVFDRATDDFYYPHTTALYPEWPFAALAHTDATLAEAVKAALLAAPSDHPALVAAKVQGFVPAEDYSSLDDLIETLQLLSWDATP